MCSAPFVLQTRPLYKIGFQLGNDNTCSILTLGYWMQGLGQECKIVLICRPNTGEWQSTHVIKLFAVTVTLTKYLLAVGLRPIFNDNKIIYPEAGIAGNSITVPSHIKSCDEYSRQSINYTNIYQE